MKNKNINAEAIIKKLELFNYWDSKVLDISSSIFFNNVTICFEFDDICIVKMSFDSCYNVSFIHFFGYDKKIDYCNLNKQQIPYFIQNIVVKDLHDYDYIRYYFKIEMFPAVIELYCKEFNLEKVSLSMYK